MDDQPDSTDEDSPPNLSIGQRVVVPCGADIDYCATRVLEWPNVVDIYCKRADAINEVVFHKFQ